MSRMNNTSRSLRIISKLNGWDPDQIDGEPLAESLLARESPFENDSKALGGRNSSNGSTTHVSIDTNPTFEQPVQRSARRYRTTNANPTPEMPGA